MTSKMLLLAAVLCLGVVLAIGFGAESATAQEVGGGTGPKLGTKQFEKEKLPNKWEMGAGVGSIFVMWAVLKWA